MKSERKSYNNICLQGVVFMLSKAVFPDQGSQEPWGSAEHRQGFLEKSWNIYRKYSISLLKTFLTII
jgi:hypothetical protein